MAVYPIGTDKAAFLKVSIACAVVLTALAMLFQKQLHALVCRFRTTTAQVILRRALSAILLFTGFKLLHLV